ncbi:MAG: MarR family transcriptional regulator [Balneolaceae bacterium]|nr:MarR family transcriptional regulator [Balneolaceae bacterium]
MADPQDVSYSRKIAFTEKISVIFEEAGEPRISGQILGWLLVCDPPEQSFSQLVEHLQVSKGSISTMTRRLLQSGLIVKTRKQGERQVYFRLAENAWSRVMEHRLKFAHTLRDMAGEWLEGEEGRSKGDSDRAGEAAGENTGKDAGQNAVDTSRLREMHAFHQFVSEKLEETIEEYNNKRDTK